MAEPRRRVDEDDEDEDDRPRRRNKKNPHEADYYKVSAGFTTALGVHDHAEIVSHEDMGPGFNALHPDEQEERFFRVMYVPHTPTPEEKRALGHGRVKAGPSPQQEAEAEEREEEESGEATEPKQLKDMDDDELYKMAQAEGLSLPRETPRNILEGALAKHMREQEEQQRKLAAEHKTTEPRKGRNGGNR